MPSLRCFFCSRSLKEPVLFFNGQPVGTTCAKKHNLFTGPAKRRITRASQKPKQAERDPLTLDLFDLLGNEND